MQKRIFILLMLALGSATCTYAQSAEEQLKACVDKIQYWRFQYSPEDSGANPNANPQDSLIAANNNLAKFLLGGNAAAVQSGNQAFEDAGLKIISSEDKALRIYSWNTETGDDKHKYQSVLEYKTSSGLKTVAGTDENEYTQVYTIGGNHKYYLAVYGNILSVKDALKGVRVFSINNNLEEAKILHTQAGLAANTEYTYDYSANFSFKKMKEENVIHLEKQKLYMPEVKDDNITGKWQVYVFDGNEFVPDNNSK